MPANEIVLINGACFPLNEGKVPVTDRSFLFGDSVYEVITTRRGRPFFSDDHLQRLRASARGIYMELPWDEAYFKRLIRQGLDTSGLAEAYIRIVVSRGAGDPDISLDATRTPPMNVIIFRPAPVYAPELYERGFHLAVPEHFRNDPRSLSPALKTGNYMNNVLCLAQAKKKGAADALILALDGSVTEATTSNFFLVKGGQLWTSPIEVGILAGITRKYIIQVARDLGIPVVEQKFGLEAIWKADEAFVTSTTKGAMPVYKVDDHVIRETCGELTRTLDKAYWDYVESHLDGY